MQKAARSLLCLCSSCPAAGSASGPPAWLLPAASDASGGGHPPAPRDARDATGARAAAEEEEDPTEAEPFVSWGCEDPPGRSQLLAWTACRGPGGRQKGGGFRG